LSATTLQARRIGAIFGRLFASRGFVSDSWAFLFTGVVSGAAIQWTMPRWCCLDDDIRAGLDHKTSYQSTLFRIAGLLMLADCCFNDFWDAPMFMYM